MKTQAKTLSRRAKSILSLFLLPICALGLLLSLVAFVAGALADWLEGCLPKDL